MATPIDASNRTVFLTVIYLPLVGQSKSQPRLNQLTLPR
jgi:hypothetical protein